MAPGPRRGRRPVSQAVRSEPPLPSDRRVTLVGMIPLNSLSDLVAAMEEQGYDFDPDDQEFLPRADGPARGKLVLDIKAALEWLDPDRFLDRSDEVRVPPLPPVRWPPGA